MIIVNMRGRLGNQMFIYAFTKMLNESKDDIVIYDFHEVVSLSNTDVGFENSLIYFNIPEMNTINLNQSIFKEKSNLLQKILIALLLRSTKYIKSDIIKDNYLKNIQPLLNRVGIYYSPGAYVPIKKSLIKNKLVFGSFESEKYFENIREELLIEFTPKAAPLSKNHNLYNEINTKESVCVTIRRGDFLNKNQKKRHYVCDEAYFYKAMEIMKQKVKQAVFIIFSDDIDWVRANMEFKYPVMYEDGSDPVWEKIRLMYQCKHFIISNSTFSWWAQYLSRNENKIVISPEKWTSDGYPSSLINDSWIKIKTDVNNKME